MKDKILAVVKTKFGHLGFSEATLGTYAAHLAKYVTEESQIDSAVDESSDLLKGFQGDGDRRATEAVKKLQGQNQPNNQQPDAGKPAEDSPKVPEGIDPVLKTLLEKQTALIQGLTSKIEGLEKGNLTSTREQQFKAKIKDLNQTIQDSLLKDFKRMNFENDDDFNGWSEEKLTAFKDFKASSQEQQTQNQNPFAAVGGGGAGENGKTDVNASIKNWAEKTKPAATSKP